MAKSTEALPVTGTEYSEMGDLSLSSPWDVLNTRFSKWLVLGGQVDGSLSMTNSASWSSWKKSPFHNRHFFFLPYLKFVIIHLQYTNVSVYTLILTCKCI